MEVMRLHFESTVGKSGQARCFDVDDIVLVLKRPFDEKKLTTRDQPIAIIEIGRNDNISDARLVLHRNEDESFRCARSLTGDDAASHADILSVTAFQEILAERILLRLSSARR
jgi:hypothetical protein